MKPQLKAVHCLLVTFFLTAAASLQAQAPQVINYQGKLVIGGRPLQTTAEITFTIFGAATGGTALWSEKQLVTPSNGIFNVFLGSVTPFPRDLFTGTEQRWLALNVGNNPPLGQRTQITSVAYALKANSANALDAPDGDPTNAVVVDNNGNVGIGTTSPAANLHVASSDITTNLRISATGGFGNVAVLQLEQGGDGWNIGTGALDFGGQSALGFRPLLNNNTRDDTRMVITKDGNVGIGTTVPEKPLHIKASGVDEFGVSKARLIIENGFGHKWFLNTFSSIDQFGIGRVGKATDIIIDSAGNVTIPGTLSKGGGSFKIDHPLDPANKYLYHSFVESPDMMNIYNGNVILDANGEAWVQLPDWFEALNRDFRYQLTSIGGFAPVYIAEKIQGNRFKIAGGTPGLEVSWQVTGVRQDAYANAHRILVEEDKPTAEQGRYLHPELYGQSNTIGFEKSK
jgi:hypothetical protein